MQEQEVRMMPLPAVYVMETTMPQSMVDPVNDYIDEYRKKEDRKSLAPTLVGQIHQGEQLLLDHTDERLSEYNQFICNLGADYINYYGSAGNKVNGPKQVETDETWSVHSYDGDYNPIHDHGTKTIMGISTTAWTKVPQQILDQPTAGSPLYNKYESSGVCDGYLAFNYGRNEIMNVERLRPPQSFEVKHEGGKLY